METQTIKNSTPILHNYQVDYVKLKLYKVDTSRINWSEIKAHPVLKNHYTLDFIAPNYHGKNFDMYIDKGNNITIKTSVPYLLEDQNYTDCDEQDIGYILIHLLNSTRINFPDAIVQEFEYGVFERINIPESLYLKNIKGVLGKDLLKSTSYMKMFGDNEIHYKIYDAVANAKRKKTFTRGNYPKSRLIKHELKFKNPQKTFGKPVTAFRFCDDDFLKQSRLLLEYHMSQLVFRHELSFTSQDSSMTHLLFTSLKNAEARLETTTFNLVKEVIESSNLTSSQKSKRKKSLLELEVTYNAQLEKR